MTTFSRLLLAASLILVAPDLGAMKVWKESAVEDGKQLPDTVGVIERAEDAHRILGEHERDTGDPLKLSRKERRALGQVYTNPGDLPQLQVEVEGKKLDLPLKHTHVKAEMTGYVAQVEVTQTYQNPFAYPIEAIYVFPLPENSAVDDMKMIIGDRVIEAEIKKRDDARRTYEDARRNGYTAALLEQERPNIFTQSVANIEPGTDIDVVIRYVQNLTYDAGQYEFVFPMVVGPRFFPGSPSGHKGSGSHPDTDSVPDASRISPPVLGGGVRSGHDISIELVADAGLPIKEWDVPTHDVDYLPTYDGSLALTLKKSDSMPNRDFILRYSVDGKRPQATLMSHRKDDNGFVTLIVQPPKLDIDDLVGTREIIFVVDVSGSMSGVPLSMCQDAMREAIRKLRPVDTFNVITFAGHTRKTFSQPYPANETNIKAAMQVINGLSAGGGTMMANAVRDALSPDVEEGRHRYVFFLTDGYVGNEREIFAGAESLVKAMKRRGQRAKVFGYGVGSSVNRHLLDGLSKAGNGVTVYASTREDPAIAVNTFFRYIDHSILRDVEIDWGGLDVVEVFPKTIPDLFASRPLIVHARYGTPGKAEITVRGIAGRKKMELPIEVTLAEKANDHQAIGTLWARAKIGSLERDMWHGRSSQIVDQITQLGIEHRIVTQYTSFVAVDRSKVVEGDARTLVQPVEAPEGVDARKAGARIVSSQHMVHNSSAAPMPAQRRVRAQYMLAPSAAPAPATASPYGTVGGGGGGQPTGGGAALLRGGGGGGASRLSGKGRSGYRVQGLVGKLPSSALKVGGGGGGALVQKKTRGMKVQGSLDRAVIQKVINSRIGTIQRCYERELLKTPGLLGKVVVRWFISAQGIVIQVRIKSSTMKNPAFEQCLMREIKKMKFPRPKGGGSVEIVYPFIFSAAR